jgi:hypothetical protein
MVRVHFRAQNPDRLAIHRNPTGQNHLLTGAARSHTGISQKFL